MILLYLTKIITLLNFHVSSRIVTKYHFESRNVVSLVFLSPYVFTHSPCYCDSVCDKYKELYGFQLHQIYHNFRANRSTDSNCTDRQTDRQATGTDTDGQRSRAWWPISLIFPRLWRNVIFLRVVNLKFVAAVTALSCAVTAETTLSSLAYLAGIRV
jgi:hypothetical protein